MHTIRKRYIDGATTLNPREKQSAQGNDTLHGWIRTHKSVLERE